MRSFSRFTSEDLSDVLELHRELAELPVDRTIRAEHMVRGLARIVRAQVGLLCEIQNYAPGKKHQIKPLLDFGWAGEEERRWNMSFFDGPQLSDPLTNEIVRQPGRVVTYSRDELVGNIDWYGSANVNELRRRARIDHCLYSNFFTEPGRGMSMAFHRAWGDSPFSARDVAIVDLVHRRQNIYSLPRTDGLSPRQQQTLRRLLAGDSEKQIAHKLKISQHTVHVYVKALYERYNVSSRGELLSRWVVGEGPESE